MRTLIPNASVFAFASASIFVFTLTITGCDDGNPSPPPDFAGAHDLTSGGDLATARDLATRPPPDMAAARDLAMAPADMTPPPDMTNLCGNGMVDDGEDCDLGAMNGHPGSGCTSACKFECANPFKDCPAASACHLAVCSDMHVCQVVVDPGQNGLACNATYPSYTCADGVCAAQPAATCGDGTRAPTEQCDDGNAVNLDGCDSQCKFELIHRLNSLVARYDVDSFCPTNAIGGAVPPGDAQVALQQVYTGSVAVGLISVVIKFLGLHDLTGGDDNFQLGFLDAAPAGVDLPTDGSFANNPYNYDGTSDLDWWYVRELASVDANETPLNTLAATIKARQLNAGPGTIKVKLSFGGGAPAPVVLFDAAVRSGVDATSLLPPTPTAPDDITANHQHQGHLPSENVAPGLYTFSRGIDGTMCSQVSADSLGQIPVPPTLTGDLLCTVEQYTTATNHLLDVFVNGCTYQPSGMPPQPAIKPTQPDGSRDGATYHFDVDAQKRVASCTRNGQTSDLATCLKMATFSSYFAFTTDRVVVKHDAPPPPPVGGAAIKRTSRPGRAHAAKQHR